MLVGTGKHPDESQRLGKSAIGREGTTFSNAPVEVYTTQKRFGVPYVVCDPIGCIPNQRHCSSFFNGLRVCAFQIVSSFASEASSTSPSYPRIYFAPRASIVLCITL